MIFLIFVTLDFKNNVTPYDILDLCDFSAPSPVPPLSVALHEPQACENQTNQKYH